VVLGKATLSHTINIKPLSFTEGFFGDFMKFIEIKLKHRDESFLVNTSEIWGLYKDKDGKYLVSFLDTPTTKTDKEVDKGEFNRIWDLLGGFNRLKPTPTPEPTKGKPIRRYP